MIVYIAILSIVVASLTAVAVSLLKHFAFMQATNDIASTASVAMERMTREIRFAHGVNTGASTLLSSPGTLALNTTDSGGNPATVTISLVGNRVYLTESGGGTSPLTRSTVNVTNLVFTYTVGTQSHAVRIDMTLERPVRGTVITEEFRTFVVLDAS